jgi:hypothetical protein
MGTFQPLRMLEVDHVILFHAWFLVLFLSTRGTLGLSRSEPIRRLLRIAALTGLGLALVYGGNGRLALADIRSERVARWEACMEARIAAVRGARERGIKRLEVPALRRPDQPWLYASGMGITEDPRHQWNVYYARYHGLRSVRVARPEASPAPAR